MSDHFQLDIDHYNDVIMTIASQITSATVVHSTVYSDADQTKHQSSALLAFVWGIHRTGEFPAQGASYAENVSIWWRHHAKCVCCQETLPDHPLAHGWLQSRTGLYLKFLATCIMSDMILFQDFWLLTLLNLFLLTRELFFHIFDEIMLSLGALHKLSVKRNAFKYHWFSRS